MLPNIETLENQAQMGMHTPSQSFRFTVQRKPPNPRRVEKTQWASKYKKRQKDKKKKKDSWQNKQRKKQRNWPVSYRMYCGRQENEALWGFWWWRSQRERERERERDNHNDK